jgi:hypothetical protein
MMRRIGELNHSSLLTGQATADRDDAVPETLLRNREMKAPSNMHAWYEDRGARGSLTGVLEITCLLYAVKSASVYAMHLDSSRIATSQHPTDRLLHVGPFRLSRIGLLPNIVNVHISVARSQSDLAAGGLIERQFVERTGRGLD